jgi:hypothetical protein
MFVELLRLGAYHVLAPRQLRLDYAPELESALE